MYVHHIDFGDYCYELLFGENGTVEKCVQWKSAFSRYYKGILIIVNRNFALLGFQIQLRFEVPAVLGLGYFLLSRPKLALGQLNN